MVRKLAAAMLGAGVFIPGLANALGLGEIKLNSALSEPLDAEIELVQVRELTEAEILPALAGESDFNAADVERFHFLTDLRFDVVVDQRGKSFIKIRSRKPVKEPFLNFLVEVTWPAGRLLREYTLLLDPPIYAQKQAAAVTQPKTETRTTFEASPAPESRPPQSSMAMDAPQSEGPSTAAPSPSPSSSADKTHVVSANDSLWSIAERLKPSDEVSIQQTMMAMQRSNPDAFIDNNINLLKKGQVLRAPTEAEAMQLTSREAIALAAEQNRLWRTKIASAPEARQMDLSGKKADTSAGSTSSPEARLKLVSGDAEGTGDSGQGGAGDIGKLRDELAVAEENVDKFSRENENLSLKVSDLEEQLETSEKVLSLKDEQIAALQAKIRELEQEQASNTPADPLASEETKPMDTDTIAAETDVMANAEMAPTTEEDVDYNFEQEGSAQFAEDQPPVAEAIETPEQETTDTAETVAPPAPKPEPQSTLQSLLSNPVYLGVGAGAIVLLLIAGLMLARRKPEPEEDEFLENSADDFSLPVATEPEDEIQQFQSVDLEEDEDFESAVEASAEEKTVPQTGDVIGEADIYIAYGRHPQAIEMLERAADNEPERADIRVKLCEVSADSQAPDVFSRHYEALSRMNDAEALGQVEPLRERLGLADAPEMGEPPAEPLADESFDSGPTDFGSDDDFTSPDSLETPDYSESLEFDISQPDTAPEADLEQESDTGLDFDLGDLEDTATQFTGSDSDTADTTESNEQDLTADETGLDFDLDLDLEESDSSEGIQDVQDQPSEQSSETLGDQTVEFDTSAFDFDLDEDTNKTADSEDELQNLSEEDSSGEEPSLDSESAAQLADELDLDSDFFGDDNLSAEPIEPQTPEQSGQDTSHGSLDFEADDVAPANDYAGEDDELDFLADADESSTKLDLARAYIDMGDRDGAKDILDEVLQEGNDDQKTEAKDLLVRLES